MYPKIALLCAGLSMLLLGSTSGLAQSLNNDLTPLCASSSCVDYSGANAILSYDGVTHIAAKDWGPKLKGATTFLFIHGYPHGQGLWIQQILASNLRQNFRLVTMDTRGSGFSDVASSYTGPDFAKDIQAVIATLGLKNVILVAHSYGGTIATAYMAYGTIPVRGIVWVAALPDVVNATIGSSEALILQTLADNPVSVAATQPFVTASHDQPFSDALNTEFLNMDMQTSFAGRLGQLSSPFFHSDNSGIVAGITVPCLIIQGSDDHIIVSANSDTLQSELVNSKRVTRVTIGGTGAAAVGHIPQLEATAAFNKALEKFASGF